MFSFFKKKTPVPAVPPAPLADPAGDAPAAAVPVVAIPCPGGRGCGPPASRWAGGGRRRTCRAGGTAAGSGSRARQCDRAHADAARARTQPRHGAATRNRGARACRGSAARRRTRDRAQRLAGQAQARPAQDRLQHRHGVHRHEDRRRALRGTGNRPAAGRHRREGHGLPAGRSQAPREGSQNHRPGRRQGPAGRGHRCAADAAAKIPGHRRASTHRDHGGRGQWRGQDHLDRQADQPPCQLGRHSSAGRGRHLPRRRARTARHLGRPQHGRDHQPARR